MGDGELSLQELIASLDVQLKQKHQLKFQRYIIIAGVALLLCSFGLSLGSSVLSFMLMSQSEVRGQAFTDREGHVLGSQPRHPTVDNVTRKDESTSARRLDNVSDMTPSLVKFTPAWQLPVDDFKQSFEKYKSGVVEFIVPVHDAMYTVRVTEVSENKETGSTSARGLVAGNEWRLSCEAHSAFCAVESVRELHHRAGRRLKTSSTAYLSYGAFEFPCGCPPGYEVLCEYYNVWIHCPETNDRNRCYNQWCFPSAAAADEARKHDIMDKGVGNKNLLR